MTYTFNVLLIGFLFSFQTAFTQNSPFRAFSQLLTRANMIFQKPGGVQETPTIANRQMNYEYAVKYTHKNFEVRYAIRPLDYLLEDYTAWQKKKKPGDIMLDPNTLYSSLLQVTILNISGGQLPDIAQFDSVAVRQEFNADWGATAFVEVGKEFGQSYKYCMVVALHKENYADAYIFYLSDTKEGFAELMDAAFYSLRFK
ncbi:hypothetical protein QNI16_07005 [Cytophagaceae bacterium YF14B1]|uniref:Uncharacterized protein n=2 Tax=Xanthocytophaga TaxID=3078918 RepID=A0AAE3U663_9BACT|nr:hypothetical protein [Xanthocytophaga flavus]MDJ1480227.1 hypothetical protein [Xanthocytophaga flavus]